MAEHDHTFELTHIEDAPVGAQGRQVTITCDCGVTIKRITKRTDEELLTELNG